MHCQAANILKSGVLEIKIAQEWIKSKTQAVVGGVKVELCYSCIGPLHAAEHRRNRVGLFPERRLAKLDGVNRPNRNAVTHETTPHEPARGLLRAL